MHRHRVPESAMPPFVLSHADLAPSLDAFARLLGADTLDEARAAYRAWVAEPAHARRAVTLYWRARPERLRRPGAVSPDAWRVLADAVHGLRPTASGRASTVLDTGAERQSDWSTVTLLLHDRAVLPAEAANRLLITSYHRDVLELPGMAAATAVFGLSRLSDGALTRLAASPALPTVTAVAYADDCIQGPRGRAAVPARRADGTLGTPPLDPAMTVRDQGETLMDLRQDQPTAIEAGLLTSAAAMTGGGTYAGGYRWIWDVRERSVETLPLVLGLLQRSDLGPARWTALLGVLPACHLSTAIRQEGGRPEQLLALARHALHETRDEGRTAGTDTAVRWGPVTSALEERLHARHAPRAPAELDAVAAQLRRLLLGRPGYLRPGPEGPEGVVRQLLAGEDLRTWPTAEIAQLLAAGDRQTRLRVTARLAELRGPGSPAEGAGREAPGPEPKRHCR